MKLSISGKSCSMSRNSTSNARSAFFRSAAVSKMFWNRTRIAYSVRSRGNFPNNSSSLACSSSVRPRGLRRNSHIRERNSFRWAFDSLALYARVIFFPLAVHRLVEQLGDVEPVHHRLGVGQQPPAGVVEGQGHVGPE